MRSLPGSDDVPRILTYNVHRCIGMDGHLSPQRIANVIAPCRPDIVCLQELDVGRVRTRGVDQAHAIARELGMHMLFHAALQVMEEQYGNAVLTPPGPRSSSRRGRCQAFGFGPLWSPAAPCGPRSRSAGRGSR